MTTANQSHSRAVVTGASSGIGAAFAEQLARDHYDLLVVARRRDRLEALAQRLQEAYGIQVEVLAADLARSDELRMVEQHIGEDTALDFLINNAGFGGYMPFTALEPDRAEELIGVQVIAVTRLTRAALPGMIAHRRGSIINVSSRLAFSGSLNAPNLPRRAVYAATKAYINTFTQILSNELEGTGVKVQALCPGVVLTEFHTKMGMDPARLPGSIVMQPAELVEAALAGLQRGEIICVPALDDPNLLAQADEAQRRVLEHSGSGMVAPRYTA